MPKSGQKQTKRPARRGLTAFLEDKRYEVFISSTFIDLKEEREKVTRAVLKLDCFPAGMELFPAADATQWKVIQRAINRCDYYVVLVAGRYGSKDEDNLSYTEKEFDYAVLKRIPILAFVHGDPDSIQVGKTDQNDEARKRLEAFRKKVSTGRMCNEWFNSDDLAGKVALALTNAIKNSPRPGWVRGTLAGARAHKGGRTTRTAKERPYQAADDGLSKLSPAKSMLPTYLEQTPRRPDVEVSLNYKKQSISSDIHHYELVVLVRNNSTKRLNDWEVDVEFPTPLLEPGVVVGGKVNSRSDHARSLFRAGSESFKEPLRPGDKRELKYGYRWDKEIYNRQDEFLNQLATAKLSVDGQIVATAERPIRELKDY